MKKNILLFITVLLFSCASSKVKLVVKNKEKKQVEEVKFFSKEIYNFWSFNGNGNNSNSLKPNWSTSRIVFTDSTLVSDGIYENSGRFTSERAEVLERNYSLTKHSIAIRFKLTDKIGKNMPILVGGKYYRWLRIIAFPENIIKISVTGNSSFSLPNADVKIKKIKFNAKEFNSLFLSWNIEKHEFYIAINNSEPQVISIPKDFNWDKFGKEWTLQDYSNGDAFKGEIDYFLSVKDYLTREQMLWIIKTIN